MLLKAAATGVGGWGALVGTGHSRKAVGGMGRNTGWGQVAEGGDGDDTGGGRRSGCFVCGLAHIYFVNYVSIHYVCVC